MTIQSSPPITLIPNHPPLAHDAQGCKVAVPQGTEHWRILRFTAGRPKTMSGRFDLDLTPEQLLEMFGPGRYRVEALDQYGKTLGEVANVVVGMPPESAPTESANQNVRTIAPTSDARFMLETLAQMSRAHSESLQSLANAQADWIKTLATAKQLPRNAAAMPLLPTTIAPTEPPEPEPWWSHLLKPPAITAIGGVARNLVAYFMPAQQAAAEAPKRRNSALAQIADNVAAAKEAQAKDTDFQAALERAFKAATSKNEPATKANDAPPSMEKKS